MLRHKLSPHYFTFQENKMKHFRTFSAALVLTIALAAPTFAGVIECPVAPPSPPSAAPTASAPDAESDASTDPVTEAALSLLQSVLALF